MRGAQVFKHGPQRQNRRDIKQNLAEPEHRQAQKRLGVEQRDDGDHLRGGFELADAADRDRAAVAQFRHPFAQRRHHDFAPDDDRHRNRKRHRVQHHAQNLRVRDQKHQRRGHDQFVRDRIQKRAELRCRVHLPRQKSVQPVGARRQQKNPGDNRFAVCRRPEIHDHQHRNQRHPKQRQQVGDVDEHQKRNAKPSRREVWVALTSSPWNIFPP